MQLDDREIANDAAKYCREYPIEHLLYSRRTSGAVAARMQPAGIPILDMDGDYPQSCDEMLGAINSGRLKHRGQSELTTQMLSAVQLRRGDGGWVLGRRASQSAIPAAVQNRSSTSRSAAPARPSIRRRCSGRSDGRRSARLPIQMGRCRRNRRRRGHRRFDSYDPIAPVRRGHFPI